MPTFFSQPEPEIIQWVSNTAQIGVSAFVDDLQYQTVGQVAATVLQAISGNTANLSGVVYYNDPISELTNNVGYITASNVLFYSNVSSILSPVYSNIQSVSNTLSTSIISLNSNLNSQVNNLSAYVSSQVATLSSSITICQGNIASIGASINNIQGDISNITSTSTLQYSNIYSSLGNLQNQISNINLSSNVSLTNVVFYGNLANIHLSSFYNDLPVSNVSSANVLYYSNLSTVDVRMIGNTSNILYQGANVSLLNNDASYITANSSPTFNNITINGTANVGTVLNVPVANTLDIYCVDEYVSNSITVGIEPNAMIIQVITGRDGGKGLKIAQDVLGGVSLIADGLGIAMGIGSAIKSMMNADGSPSELEEEAATSSLIDWDQLKRAPMGFTGTITKDVGIQHDLYMGGSIFYDDSYTDITENFNGSVMLNSTSGGVKIID